MVKFTALRFRLWFILHSKCIVYMALSKQCHILVWSGHMDAVTHCVYQFVNDDFSPEMRNVKQIVRRVSQMIIGERSLLYWLLPRFRLKRRSRNHPSTQFDPSIICSKLFDILRIKWRVIKEYSRDCFVCGVGLEMAGLGYVHGHGHMVGHRHEQHCRTVLVLQHWLLWPGLHLLRLGLAAQAAS